MPKPIRLFAVLGALIVCAVFALPTMSSVAPSKADNNPVETVTPVPVSYKTTKAIPTRQELTSLRRRVAQHRSETWRWQDLSLKPRTGTGFQEQWLNTPWKLRQLKSMWWHRRIRAYHGALNPPHKGQWLCIHSYEGAWTAATGNGYYGGLQMDITFQKTYGARLYALKDTANHWTPLEQMWVAERAYASGRGFHPWPNTAHYCGLI